MTEQKQKRLQLLAKRAGDLMVKSYDPKCNLRSKHFLNKMNRILRLVQQEDKGACHGSN